MVRSANLGDTGEIMVIGKAEEAMKIYVQDENQSKATDVSEKINEALKKCQTTEELVKLSDEISEPGF